MSQEKIHRPRSRRSGVHVEEEKAWISFYRHVGNPAIATEVMHQLESDLEMKRAHLALYLRCKESLRMQKARQARRLSLPPARWRFAQHHLRGGFGIAEIEPIAGADMTIEQPCMDRTPRCSAIDATDDQIGARTEQAIAPEILVPVRLRHPVQPVKLIQAMDRHDRLEAPHIGRTIQLATHVRLGDAVAVEGRHMQPVGMPQSLQMSPPSHTLKYGARNSAVCNVGRRLPLTAHTFQTLPDTANTSPGCGTTSPRSGVPKYPPGISSVPTFAHQGFIS